MSFRNRIIVLGSLAGILSVTLAAGLFTTQRVPPGEGVRLLAVAPQTVQRLVIKGPETTELIRADDGERWWLRVDGDLLPARAARVERFLQSATEARSTRRVASDRLRWADFALDGEGRYTVVLYQEADRDGDPGTELARAVFGDRTEQGREVFVRIGDEDATYAAVAADIHFSLQRDRLYWAELRLLPPDLTANDLSQLTIESAADTDRSTRGFSYRLQRDSVGNWTIVDRDGERIARQSRARELVAAVLSLEGARFFGNDVAAIQTRIQGATVDAESGLVARIGVNSRDGTRREINVLHVSVDGSYIAIAAGPGVPRDPSGREVAYLVPDFTLERVLRPPADLIAD